MTDPVDPVGRLARGLELLERGRREGRRFLLGIAGPPAAGKSTLAAWLVAELTQARPGEVALVGMDGFHLAGAVLDRRGLTPVKGAPHTFDGWGYLALLRRLRDEPDRTIYAPAFHREIEESIAHEVEVAPRVRLVVTEGNYLLVDDEPWRQVRDALDEVWFLDLVEPLRQQRLIARHEAYGLSPDQARARTFGSDLRNVHLVRETRDAADLVIDMSTDPEVREPG